MYTYMFCNSLYTYVYTLHIYLLEYMVYCIYTDNSHWWILLRVYCLAIAVFTILLSICKSSGPVTTAPQLTWVMCCSLSLDRCFCYIIVFFFFGSYDHYSLSRPSEYMLHSWHKHGLSVWLYIKKKIKSSVWLELSKEEKESERKISRFTCGERESVFKMGNVNASALNFQSNVNEPNQVVITGFS